MIVVDWTLLLLEIPTAVGGTNSMNLDQTAVELLGATCLVVTGVSHWRHPMAWQGVFARWAAEGHSGVFINGLLHAGVGALFVGLHPVFTGLSSALSYWALAVLAKGLAYLLFPAFGLARMRELTPDRAVRLRVAAVPMTLLGLAIGAIAVFC